MLKFKLNLNEGQMIRKKKYKAIEKYIQIASIVPKMLKTKLKSKVRMTENGLI